VVESAYNAVVALIAYIYASLMPVGAEKARWRPDLPSINLGISKVLGNDSCLLLTAAADL